MEAGRGEQALGKAHSYEYYSEILRGQGAWLSRMGCKAIKVSPNACMLQIWKQEEHEKHSCRKKKEEEKKHWRSLTSQTARLLQSAVA
jgi:hypothetical protein